MHRFQFIDRLYLIGTDTFPSRLDTLDADKRFGIDCQRFTEAVVPAEKHFDAGIRFVGKSIEAVLRVLSHQVLSLPAGIKLKTLEINVFLVGIIEHGRPYLTAVVPFD